MKIQYNVDVNLDVSRNQLDAKSSLNNILLFEIIKRIDKISSKKKDEVDEMELEFLKIDRTSLDSFSTNLTIVNNLKDKLDYLIQMHTK